MTGVTETCAFIWNILLDNRWKYKIIWLKLSTKSVCS